jgi:hypothetical protein
MIYTLLSSVRESSEGDVAPVVDLRCLALGTERCLARETSDAKAIALPKRKITLKTETGRSEGVRGDGVKRREKERGEREGRGGKRKL